MLLPQRKWIWKCLNSILRIQSHGRHNDAVIKTTQTSQKFPIKLIIETQHKHLLKFAFWLIGKRSHQIFWMSFCCFLSVHIHIKMNRKEIWNISMSHDFIANCANVLLFCIIFYCVYLFIFVLSQVLTTCEDLL